jgi:hypothetical protein
MLESLGDIFTTVARKLSPETGYIVFEVLPAEARQSDAAPANHR